MQERLRGVNLGGWFSQIDCIQEKDPGKFPGLFEHVESFIGELDIKRIYNAGFNHVRLPIDYFNLFEPTTLKPNERMFLLLDKAITDICSNGLNVILDLHKCPGHDFHLGSISEQPFFESANARKNTAYVWSHLAERYSSNQQVLMELLNEPAAADSRVWDKVKDEIFWAVRKHAQKNTIVVGSNKWNSAHEFKYLTPLDDDNTIYSFHTYTPVTFTHQGAAWITDPFFNIKRSWPGDYAAPIQGGTTRLDVEYGKWDKSRLQQSIQNAIDFRTKYNLPVACNEFGVYVQVERKYQMAWINDFLDILRSADIGYTYWNYKNLDFGLVSIGESLHESLSQYNNPEHLDFELMQIIAQG